MDILEIRKHIRAGADFAWSAVYRQEKENQEAAPFVLEIFDYLSKYVPLILDCRGSERVSLALNVYAFAKHKDVSGAVKDFLEGVFFQSGLGVNLVLIENGLRIIRRLPVGSEVSESWVDINFFMDDEGFRHG